MKSIKINQNGQNSKAQNGQNTESSSAKMQAMNDGICDLNPDQGSTSLSESAMAGLLYMIEEEKMAMDLYGSFADQYDGTIFARISDSELHHMDALIKVAMVADVDLSLVSSEAGVFSDATIQTLYDSLLAQGSQSLQAAIDVGITVEQTDIADLEQYVGNDSLGLLGVVYDHLQTGSEHHLAAFSQYEIMIA